MKVSPLANWTKQQVWAFITKYNIPYNPLNDQGYTSIGCWPCTRAVLLGEDERAGRWSLFFGYYIAGVRHFTAMVAGASALEYPIFAGFAYCGAFVWVLTFLSIGYFVGDRWQGASEEVHRDLLVGCIVLGAILGIYLLARYLWRKS